MKKVIIALLTVFALSGCSDEPETPKFIKDQQLRREIFKECLESVPKGPKSTTVSNDWSEVVEECGYQADKMSTFTAEGYISLGEIRPVPKEIQK